MKTIRMKSICCAIICLSVLLTMIGCSAEDESMNWEPPATTPTAPSGFSAEEVVEDYLADHFAGCEYVTTKNIIVDNAIAFDVWNNKTNIISSQDDSLTFACTQTGSFGIAKKAVVDISKPIYIQLSAEFDTDMYNVHINAFESGGKSLSATVVRNGTKQYVLNVSASQTNEIQLIISATGNEENIGQPISISAVNVWQEKEKFSVVAGVDEEKVIEIVENANLSNDAYYTAPNGEKYQLQVRTDGSLTMVPVIPAKALYVGNSLLMGFEFGMAASDSEHDYFHLINQVISSKKRGYTATKLSGTQWEGAATSAAQEAFLNNVLAPKLSDDLELVVVQLGDNVNTDEKLSVFAEGSRKMLEFIRTKCPRARVVWVGAWYQTAEKQEQMKQACQSTGCTFISIWDLATTENKNKVGNSYIDKNGNTQTITSEGVASHPNDEGFRKIANRLLYKLGIVDTEEYYKKDA